MKTKQHLPSTISFLLPLSLPCRRSPHWRPTPADQQPPADHHPPAQAAPQPRPSLQAATQRQPTTTRSTQHPRPEPPASLSLPSSGRKPSRRRRLPLCRPPISPAADLPPSLFRPQPCPTPSATKQRLHLPPFFPSSASPHQHHGQISSPTRNHHPEQLRPPTPPSQSSRQQRPPIPIAATRPSTTALHQFPSSTANSRAVADHSPPLQHSHHPRQHLHSTRIKQPLPLPSSWDFA